MLKDQIKKLFNQDKEVQMKEQEDNGQANAAVNMTAELAKANEALASSVQEMQKLKAQLDEAQAALASLKAVKEQMETAAKEAKMTSRLSAISAAIGDVKAPALLAATENMDDAGFEAIVSAMAGSVEAEAKTALFKEVGVDAKADASKEVAEESAVMKALKKQYGA